MELPPVPHAITPDPLTVQTVCWIPSLPPSLSLFLSVSRGPYISPSLSLHSAPPCLVRGQIYLSCQTWETYTLSLPHTGKGIFSQRGNWHAIIMFSLPQTSFAKYIASCFWLTWVYDLLHGTAVLHVYCGCFSLCPLMADSLNSAKGYLNWPATVKLLSSVIYLEYDYIQNLIQVMTWFGYSDIFRYCSGY